MFPVFAFADDEYGLGNETTTVTQNEKIIVGQEEVVTLQNPLKGVNSIGDLVYKVIDFFMGLSYVVLAIFLILSGFKFVKAQGNPEELEDAKRTFKFTIIGGLLLIGANTIVKVLEKLINDLNVKG